MVVRYGSFRAGLYRGTGGRGRGGSRHRARSRLHYGTPRFLVRWCHTRARWSTIVLCKSHGDPAALSRWSFSSKLSLSRRARCTPHGTHWTPVPLFALRTPLVSAGSLHGCECVHRSLLGCGVVFADSRACRWEGALSRGKQNSGPDSLVWRPRLDLMR